MGISMLSRVPLCDRLIPTLLSYCVTFTSPMRNTVHGCPYVFVIPSFIFVERGQNMNTSKKHGQTILT